MPTTTTDAPRMFAYGLYNLPLPNGSTCHCPAMEALDSVPLFGPLPDIYTTYDAILEARHQDEQGVVPEREARDAWLEAMRRRRAEGRDVSAAEDVARRLGWLPSQGVV